MAKASGGTKSTNSKTVHSGISAGVSSAVSKFNSIKLNSAQAFMDRKNAMVSALGKMSTGTQVDLTHEKYGQTYSASFVKDSSGTFVQKHTADEGNLESHFDKWTPDSISVNHTDFHMTVKKYKRKN